MKTEKPVPEQKPRKILIPYARVSSSPQAVEDATGLERQLASARRTLAAHPEWELDDKFSLVDAGLSGYKGKNLDPDAALGGFLKALKEGKIPLTPTKVLHIDEMSRLSRLPIKRARALFEGILESGVEIYVAQDSKLYTKESLDNSMDLIISLLRIEAANKYGKELGSSIRRGWQIIKERAVESGKPYRTKPPGWLRWKATSETEGHYEPIPERAESIRHIFELALQGHGVRTIVKRLNQEKATLLSTYNGKTIQSRCWSNTTVQKVIHNKAACGWNENLQPALNMYPEVIDEKVWYAVKLKMDERKSHKYYGRTTNAKNLFVHLAHCSTCGRRMCLHVIKRNRETKRNPNGFGTRGGIGARGGDAESRYLWCEAYVSAMCSSKQIKYDFVEESFVAAVSCSVHTLTLSDANKKASPDNDAELLKRKLTETRQSLHQYTEDYKDTPTKTGLKLIGEAEQEEERLLAAIESATALDIGTAPLNETKKELMALMYKDWSQEDTRMKARELIRGLVEKIVVNIKSQSYTVKWKAREKPTEVELVKRGHKLGGYKIDGTFYPSMGRDWKKATADIARYARDVAP